MIIKIADIPISIITSDSQSKKVLKECYRTFFSLQKPEVNIRLHYYIPTIALKDKDYVIGEKDILDVYQLNGKYIFVFKATSNKKKEFQFKIIGHNKEPTLSRINPKKILKAFPHRRSGRVGKMSLNMKRIAIFSLDFKKGNIYSEFPPALNLPKDALFPSILLTSRLHPLYGILMTNLLSLNQGLLFHGCGIMDKKRGYLFIGHSGSGKSTMAKLWLNEATVLGDEQIAVRKINAHFCLFAISWFGIVGRISTNEGVALRKIFFLHHDSRNRAFKLSAKQAFLRLLKYSFCPVWHKKAMEAMLGSCAELAQKVPCFSLHFIPDARVLESIREC